MILYSNNNVCVLYMKGMEVKGIVKFILKVLWYFVILVCEVKGIIVNYKRIDL